jgi:predicted transcriptional regulator
LERLKEDAMPDSEQNDLARLTVDLLSAYFTNNSVPSSELSGLIEQTRLALAGEAASSSSNEAVHTPAVSVEESVASRDHILSLIDGKPYKSLKRHLANNGLTPAEYRTRYGLPGDYPMVAPTYSEHRRAVAQRMGLGGRPNKAKEPVAKSGTEKFAQTKEAAPKAKPAPEKKEAVKTAATAKPRKRFARDPKVAEQAAANSSGDAVVKAPDATAPATAPKTVPAAAAKAKPKTASKNKKAPATAKSASPSPSAAAPATTSSDAAPTPATAKKPKAARKPSSTAGAKTPGASARRAPSKRETTGTSE